MLQGMTWASPPALLMPSATSWQASALRLEITTLAPSFASNSAEERPMPRLEPGMTATLPVRSNGVFFICFLPDFVSSLRGAKRRSNPYRILRRYGLLRCARNDGDGVTRGSLHRHSGAMRSIETGISRFRVHRFAMPRNDGLKSTRPHQSHGEDDSRCRQRCSRSWSGA